MRRAFTTIEILAVVAGVGLVAGLAGWKPLELFRKRPPTQQVRQLQAERDQLQAERDAAEAARAAAAQAERDRQLDQVRRAQQFTAGAAEALRRVPAEHRVPTVTAAADLTGRAELALGLAIGGLPVEQQREILRIVDQMLTGKEADLQAAREALAQIDGEVRRLAQERDRLQAEAETAAAEARTLGAKLGTVNAKLDTKTGEVLRVAEQLDQERRRAGSLGETVNRLLRWAAILAGVWLFLGWGAAPALKLLRPGRFKNFLRDVIGYLTSGFLHHDAKTKIASQKRP